MRQRASWGLIIAMGVLAGCSDGQSPTAVALPLPSQANSVSGTYVSFGHDAKTDQVFVEALRITQTGNQFSGTLESTDINKTGRSTSSSQNVRGTIDGGHATVTFDQGLGHTNRNATFEPGAITLSWMHDGQLANERFLSKTDAEYGAMLEKLKDAAAGLAAEANAVANAKKADEQAIDLTQRTQRFLIAEASWNLNVVQVRREKAVAYGDAGVKRVNQLMAIHNKVAEGQAAVVVGQMNVGQSQLDIGVNGTNQEIESVRSQLLTLDASVRGTPCLTSTGALEPGAAPSCAQLAVLVPKYWKARQRADALQAEMQSIDADAKDAYAQRLEEGKRAANLQSK